MAISLLDMKEYYIDLPHQKKAVEYLGRILLKTPAKNKLGLRYETDWIKLSDTDLAWLQRQISLPTLEKVATLWRVQNVVDIRDHVKLFSQRDNPILPYVSCNSSAHAMFVDYVLRVKLGQPGLEDDADYVRKVYSGKYGTYGHNNSMSWDIQSRVVKSYGINANYTNAGKHALIKELTENNMVAPTNFKHKGSLHKSYGGHVVLTVAYDKKKGFLIYDPFGSRMPDYKEPYKGVYWMSENEFNFRWQGLFTKYYGVI